MPEPTLPSAALDKLPSRIASKIRVASLAHPVLGTPCWMWAACKGPDGYGQVGWRGKKFRAHRLVFELLADPIPPGLHIDHLCRVSRCVNPAHLEPVTNRENCRRGRGGWANSTKTRCPRGHEYAGANLYVRPSGRRECRACNRVRTAGRIALIQKDSTRLARHWKAKRESSVRHHAAHKNARNARARAYRAANRGLVSAQQKARRATYRAMIEVLTAPTPEADNTGD